MSRQRGRLPGGYVSQNYRPPVFRGQLLLRGNCSCESRDSRTLGDAVQLKNSGPVTAQFQSTHRAEADFYA